MTDAFDFECSRCDSFGRFKVDENPRCECDEVEDGLRFECERLKAEVERMRLRADELEASMDAAQAVIVAPCIEHTELNGHIETCEELRDWLSSEAFDGETGGKLADYIKSLGIVVDQFDKQRRRANWHEAGYKAGKQKVVDYAVSKALTHARKAAKKLSALISDLGAFADDSDPRVMSVAGPMGAAEADLFIALGIDTAAAHSEMVAYIDSRCAVCGWTLAESADKGCVRGNCSYRPRPHLLYAPERAKQEALASKETPK